MILKTNLQGTHNEEKFSVVDGFLCIYGIKITLAGVKTIMEIVNLLNVEGYKIRNKWPKLKHLTMRMMRSLNHEMLRM